MEHRWTLKPQAEEEKVKLLSEAIKVNALIANLLVQRGIEDFEQAKRFFRPTPQHQFHPYRIKDMDKAVKRVRAAISEHQKILIYGDYDVDGTTAVAVVYSFLSWLGVTCEYYLPDRYAEGYGISFKGIDYAAENGFALIIALDCGIKSHDKVTYAKEKNIDFIICDHHQPDDALPKAVAVLNPKRADCKYPCKELPGCAIGFKLISALALSLYLPDTACEPYYDLVALAIASDIVPITGENRTLAAIGLKAINTNPRPGFKAIIDIAGLATDKQGLKKEITINELVFIFGPRINSAGRINSARNAVELLLSDTPEKALLSGESVNNTNSERREVDAAITLEALNIIKQDIALQNRKTTVLYNPEWSKGVIGIVASRLIERFYRPTIIFTKSNGMLTGSARSIKKFDLYEALNSCSHLFHQFGGHKYAAGITMKEENLPAFIEEFETKAATRITEEMLTPEIEIDAALTFSMITQSNYNIIKQFAPFGPGNMTPVFYSENVMLKEEPKIASNKHLRLWLYQKNSPDTHFRAIGFEMAHLLPLVSTGEPFRICYSLRENVWNGNKTLELTIKDIKT